MTAEAMGEHSLGEEVDAIFENGYGKTTKGRIALAAQAISAHVNHLDVLEEGRRISYEGMKSASRLDTSLRALGYSALFVPVVPCELESLEKTGVEHILELFEDTQEDMLSLFDPMDKAKLTLRAASDGIRAVHRLSRFQAIRAIKLSRKSAI